MRAGVWKGPLRMYLHEVWHRLQPDMIRLRHDYVLLFDFDLLRPLCEGIRTVQHHIALVVLLIRRQWVDDVGRNFVHEVVRFSRVQEARKASHVTGALSLTLRLDFLVPVIMNTRLPVYSAALGCDYNMETPVLRRVLTNT